MAERDVLEAIEKLDTRLTRVEQFLPQLATREEMGVAIKSAIDEAVAPLPTREEMHAAIKSAIDTAVAPLATRAEMHGDRSMRPVAPLVTRDEMHVAIKARRRTFAPLHPSPFRRPERRHSHAQRARGHIVGARGRPPLSKSATRGTLAAPRAFLPALPLAGNVPPAATCRSRSRHAAARSPSRRTTGPPCLARPR